MSSHSGLSDIRNFLRINFLENDEKSLGPNSFYFALGFGSWPSLPQFTLLLEGH